MSPDVGGKITKELAVVESNAAVLAEMLSGITPGQEHADDLQLLQVLTSDSSRNWPAAQACTDQLKQILTGRWYE